MKKPRRFTTKRRAKLLPGIAMSMPDEMSKPTAEQEDDSVATILCPKCGATYFVNQQCLNLLQEMQGIHEAIEEAMLRHIPCNTVFKVQPLEPVEEHHVAENR